MLISQWLLCIHSFTSLVSFTGFYTEDEPKNGYKRPKNLHPPGRVANVYNSQQTKKSCGMTSQVPCTTTSHNIYITLLGTMKTNYKRHKFPKRVTQNQKNRFTSLVVRALWLSVSPALSLTYSAWRVQWKNISVQCGSARWRITLFWVAYYEPFAFPAHPRNVREKRAERRSVS